MKVLVNGGLNLSEMDGWWAKAYTPEVGWALGDGREHGDDPARDAEDAEALYQLLEREVVPEFHARNAQGIPEAWVARMRKSMALLTPRFSASRAVREYAEQHYLPAAEAYGARQAEKGAGGRRLVDWRRRLEAGWDGLRLGECNVETTGGQHLFQVQVQFGQLDTETVRIELYADGRDGGSPVRQEMRPDGHGYRAAVPADRPPTDFTVRAIPRCEGAAVPLEAPRIRWQR
jgi:starch phosphorylase